jgi:hypothetical protein
VWWTISQLFGPAENAALPSIVEGERMAPANAILDGFNGVPTAPFRILSTQGKTL